MLYQYVREPSRAEDADKLSNTYRGRLRELEKVARQAPNMW